MIKYSHKENPSVEDYWTYCVQHQIPHIEIVLKGRDYVTVSYDLLPCLSFDKLPGDVSENIVKIYEAYVEFFKIPKDKFGYSGGPNSFGIAVRREHSEFIAERLFDYLTDYVKRNKISMADEI